MPTSKSFTSLIVIIFYVYHHEYSHWLCLQANKQIGEPTNKGAATNRYQIPTSFATSKANVRVVRSCFRFKYENIFILFSTHPACAQLRHFAMKGKIFSIFCTKFWILWKLMFSWIAVPYKMCDKLCATSKMEIRAHLSLILPSILHWLGNMVMWKFLPYICIAYESILKKAIKNPFSSWLNSMFVLVRLFGVTNYFSFPTNEHWNGLQEGQMIGELGAIWKLTTLELKLILKLWISAK